ncbi:hypothetical protein ACEPAF_8880 [Sanghuangporus sanghuang]
MFFLNSQGTEQKLAKHDTPEHSGVAERLNRTTGEKARTMLHASSFPNNLWAECVKHPIWLKSRLSTKNLGGETPYEAPTNQKPNLADLQEWGTKCWVHDNTRSKLDKRTWEGRRLGYDLSTNGSTAPKAKAYLLEEVSISHLKPPS